MKVTKIVIVLLLCLSRPGSGQEIPDFVKALDGTSVAERTPAEAPDNWLLAHVDVETNDPVGSKEAILNSLLEGIGVNRVTEIVDVRDVLRFLRRRGHADLNGGAEVLQYFAPLAVFTRASPVTLIDNNEVEEV